MRILLVHNFYQQFGGEDQVVLQELDRLQNSHDVCFYSRHNDDLINIGPMQKAKAAVAAVNSLRTKSEVAALVAQHHPEVAYVHNIYPLISPSVYDALHAFGVPIVQVVHDFRPFCANGWFYNEGGICERCKGGNYLHAIRHRCYKSSYAYSALYASTMTYLRGSGGLTKIDGFLCLTEFARQKLISAGIPARKLFVRPNCIDASQIDSAIGGGQYIAYIGRLSREKGIWTLIRAMEHVQGAVLKIAGVGPEEDAIRNYIEEKRITNIHLLGFVSGDARTAFLRDSMFTVMPSEWYEMFPMVLLEAWASGKPVIGSRLGATSDLIEDGYTGLLFEAGNSLDLAQKISTLSDSPDSIARMGAQARARVEMQYSPEASLNILMNIFREIGCGNMSTETLAKDVKADRAAAIEARSANTKSRSWAANQVTVVIPTRNRPELVARAIKSALAQTDGVAALIVVIDGPDPATLAVLRELSDGRIRYIALPESRGANHARNLGAAEATTEWVAFLDDDDEWLPQKIETQLREASGFDIVSCRFLAQSSVGTSIWPKRLPDEQESFGDYLFARRSLFNGEAAIVTSTLMVRRELLIELPFSTALRRHQDADWAIRATKAGARIRYAPQPLVKFSDDIGRVRISTSYNWRQSLEWIRSVRDCLGQQAYAGFVLTSVGSAASDKREWSAFVTLLREAFFKGRPTLLHVAIYLGFWIFPQRTRQKLRRLITASWRAQNSILTLSHEARP
jgi:glycosyltransferase involved in cell wall biosynthesis